MKVFEFYLNPKLRPHAQMLAFCYEPDKTAEKHLGNLCLAGELENILPPNKKLLKDLAEVLKTAYYQPSHESSETAMQDALKEANSFMSSLTKHNNVSWQGNLHFIVLSVAGDYLCFSKTGSIKIIMVRGGEMLDIGTELEAQSRAYSPQTFPSLISGKIEIGDKILTITPDALQFFELLNLLPFIAAIPPGKEDSQLRQILKPHQKILKDYSGLLVIWYIDKISKIKPKSEKSEPKRRALTELTLPFHPNLSNIFKNLLLAPLRMAQLKAPKIIRPLAQVKFLPRSRLQIQIPRPEISFAFWRDPLFKKRAFLIFAFAVVLALGFWMAQMRQKQAVNLAEERLSTARNTIWQAQQRLIAHKDKEANELLKQALLNLKGLEDSPRKEQAVKLATEVTEKLTLLNKIETVAEPELLFSLAELDFEVQNMELVDKAVYFLQPEQGKMYRWDFAQNKGEILELKNSFYLSTVIGNILVFYEKEGRRIFTIDGRESNLFPLYLEFNPSILTSFGNNLYFLDTNAGQISKYSLLLGQPNLAPTSWLKTPDIRLANAKSMTIDGSIWILLNNGEIHRYHGGNWQETPDLSIWPDLTKPTKIHTASALPYLYILDPAEKRIILLDKQGDVVKQYVSEKFDNLKDLAVSEDGEIIYLLNGRSVYIVSR